MNIEELIKAGLEAKAVAGVAYVYWCGDDRSQVAETLERLGVKVLSWPELYRFDAHCGSHSTRYYRQRVDVVVAHE